MSLLGGSISHITHRLVCEMKKMVSLTDKVGHILTNHEAYWSICQAENLG